MIRRWRLFYIRPGLGRIEGERADRAQVKPGAQDNITVFVLQLLKTAIQRDVARCSPGNVRLQEAIFFSAGTPRTRFTAAQGVIYLALALQNRQRSKRHHKALFTAIGLFYRHIQIARAPGWVKIVYFKRARGNRCFINAVSVLIDRHVGGGAGDAFNDRRKTIHAIRQHLFI